MTRGAIRRRLAVGRPRPRAERSGRDATERSPATDFPPLPLALRRLTRCLVETRRGLQAWYRLAPQQWSWQGDDRREALIRQLADTYAALAGRTLHLRTAQRPYPVHRWAQALAEDTPAPSNVPDGATTWSRSSATSGGRRSPTPRPTWASTSRWAGAPRPASRLTWSCSTRSWRRRGWTRFARPRRRSNG